MTETLTPNGANQTIKRECQASANIKVLIRHMMNVTTMKEGENMNET